MEVRIAVIMRSWTDVPSSIRIKRELEKYHDLGFKINMQQRTAENESLIYYFFDYDRYKEKIRGGEYHDVINGDSEDETRIRRF